MTLHNITITSGTVPGGYLFGWGSNIHKKNAKRPNVLRVLVLDSTSVGIGDEIKFYDIDGDYTFGGYVQKISNEPGLLGLEISDYSIDLTQITLNEVFPEGWTYAQTIEYLINTYTDFTFVNELNFITPSFGKPYVQRDVWVADTINDLVNVFGGGFSVDKDKVFHLFQIKEYVNPNSLINGTDSIVKPWTTDNAKRAEKVVVKGATIKQRTEQTLTGTGTEFFTARIPDNVEIDGLTQTTTNINGDYTVTRQEKKIVFDSSQVNPVVKYDYDSPLRVELGEGKTVTLEKKYIETKEEARQLAREYLGKFEDGAQSSKWVKSSSDIEAYTVGDSIYVEDSVSGYTGLYNIQEVKLIYPSRLEITVGEEEEDLFDNQKETIDRIKQLEAKDNNVDFITIDEYIINGVKVSVKTEVVKLEGYIDDGTLLWASETPLATDADLISDTGPDIDYALATDDSAVPPSNKIDYLV